MVDYFDAFKECPGCGRDCNILESVVCPDCNTELKKRKSYKVKCCMCGVFFRPYGAGSKYCDDCRKFTKNYHRKI